MSQPGERSADEPRPFGLTLITLRDLRSHPTRLIGTLAALILAVGFLVATQVYSATEIRATQARGALWTTNADVVIETHLWHSAFAEADRDEALSDAQDILKKTPGVAHWEPFSLMQARLTHGTHMAQVMLESTVEHPDLRWYAFTAGRAPTTPREIALTTEAAATLGVGLGDTVKLDALNNVPVKVVGLTSESGYSTPPAYVTMELLDEADSDFPPANYAAMADPAASADKTPYSSGDGVGRVLLVKATSPDAASALAATVQREFDDAVILHANAVTGEQVRQDVADGRLGGIRSTGLGGTSWYAGLVDGCAAMALVVGALVVSTTFSVLAAVRRRQIGLLRTLGASRRQVIRLFLAQAAILGLVGSLLAVPLGIGVAAALSRLVSHSLAFGLVIPWWRVVASAGLGVVASVLAALRPTLVASRTSPMLALQQADSDSAPVHHDSRRAGSSLALLAAGAGVATAGLWLTARTTTWGIVVLVFGVSLAGVGVLVGTPALLVPAMRCARRLARRSPQVTLAVVTTARNRTRTGAAAATLVLALGLVVTVQVAAATGRRAGLEHLAQQYPADVVLQSAIAAPDPTDPQSGSGVTTYTDSKGYLVGFSSDAMDTVRSTPGVTAAARLDSTDPLSVIAGGQLFSSIPGVALTPEASDALHEMPALSDDQIGLSHAQMSGLHLQPGAVATVTPIVGTQLELHVVEVNISDSLAFMTPATVARLKTHTKPGVIVARFSGEQPSASVITSLEGQLVGKNPGLTVGGGAQQRADLERAIDGATRMLTGLLAVVAAVALIGVANLLTLSLLERRRELGLLRALGMTRPDLRTMLLMESLLLAVVAWAVGLVGGISLGWLVSGVMTAFFQAPVPALLVPWTPIAIASAALLVAAALASVIPGNSAARTTPIEALADT